MKAGKLQCKDIPTIPILRYLREHGGIGCSWFDGWERSVVYCMPPGTPGKLVHAKMRQMLHKGLVDGCDCGCRGDWRLGDRGEELLDRLDAGAARRRPRPGDPGVRMTIVEASLADLAGATFEFTANGPPDDPCAIRFTDVIDPRWLEPPDAKEQPCP